MFGGVYKLYSCIPVQAQVEALESDKGHLGEELDNLLVDTRKLLQMKMCLGLEVATYRYLLPS